MRRPPPDPALQDGAMAVGSPFVSPAHLLLRGLIDYAGLFPPASLDMFEAVGEYRRARLGSHAWVLGRFLCPSSRLEELGATLIASMSAGEPAWEIGAIFDEAAAAAAGTAQAFVAAMEPAVLVTAVELRLPAEAADGRGARDAAEVVAPHLVAATSVSPQLKTFLEITPTANWQAGIPAAVEAIAQLGRASHRVAGAKVRCGGLELDHFPTCGQLALFIASCVAGGVPFKTTAGLHHPIRHFDQKLGGYRHGFLNILAATALAKTGAGEQILEAVLADEDPEAFSVGSAGLRWHGHRAASSVVKRMRSDSFVAYGSCSFEEPIEDLVALRILGDGR